MTMPDLWSVLTTPFVELLGWVLLHFVWQGALAAALLAGGLYLLRKHAPTVRYAVSCAVLVGLLALPVGTGLVLSDSGLVADAGPTASVVVPEGAPDGARVSGVAVAETAPSTASLRARAASWLQPMLPWIVMGWAVGVLLFSIRLAGGAWRVRRLRRTSSPAPARWRDRLRSLADQIGLHRTPSLRISPHVDGPMVAGWWRPVVLVPAGLLSGLPPEQIEALLLHELAHVRRHDVLVGRLQAVVETLLFFHPATWWISRQVRQAREACCDDWTVQAGADRTVYARALAAVAERTLTAPQPTGALAASDGSLLARIRRLLEPSATPSRNARRLSMAVALLLLIALPLGIAACASQSSTTSDAEEKAPSARPETAPPPSSPADPEETPEGPAVVVVQSDSARRLVTVRGDAAVKVDRLDDGGYVFRYEGERVDTIEVPQPEVLVRPDSLEHVLLKQVKPDSLKRALRMRIDPDRLERHARRLELRSDSLERVLRARITPDSLERVLLSRVNPDSIERLVRMRFDRDSLEQHMHRMEQRADSIAQQVAERFSDDWVEHWRTRGVPDSTVVFRFEGFDPDDFDREDVGPDLDVDSLIRRHEHRADSLHRRFERMRERIEENRSEHLREQARRLREQAERLEERAEEMEVPPDSSG